MLIYIGDKKMAIIDEKYDLDVVGCAPISLNNTHAHGTSIDMSLASDVAFIFEVGVIHDSAVLSCEIWEGETTGAVDTRISGKVVAFAGTEDGTFKTLEVNEAELTAGHKWIQSYIIETGSQAGLVAVACVIKKKYSNI